MEVKKMNFLEKRKEVFWRKRGVCLNKGSGKKIRSN